MVEGRFEIHTFVLRSPPASRSQSNQRGWPSAKPRHPTVGMGCDGARKLDGLQEPGAVACEAQRSNHVASPVRPGYPLAPGKSRACNLLARGTLIIVSTPRGTSCTPYKLRSRKGRNMPGPGGSQGDTHTPTTSSPLRATQRHRAGYVARNGLHHLVRHPPTAARCGPTCPARRAQLAQRPIPRTASTSPSGNPRPTRSPREHKMVTVPPVPPPVPACPPSRLSR